MTGWVAIDSETVINIPDASPEKWRSFEIGAADHILHTTHPGLINVLTDVKAPYEGHDCQLSKARGVTECLDPGHDLDAAALREFLIILGVADDPYPSGRRGSMGGTTPARGWCRYCRRTQAVTVQGRLYLHENRSHTGACRGSRRRPAQPPEVAA